MDELLEAMEWMKQEQRRNEKARVKREKEFEEKLAKLEKDKS